MSFVRDSAVFSSILVTGAYARTVLEGETVAAKMVCNNLVTSGLRWPEQAIPGYILSVKDELGNLGLSSPYPSFWIKSLQDTYQYSERPCVIGANLGNIANLNPRGILDVYGISRLDEIATQKIRIDTLGRIESPGSFQLLNTATQTKLVLQDNIRCFGELQIDGTVKVEATKFFFPSVNQPAEDILVTTQSWATLYNKTLRNVSLQGDARFVGTGQIENIAQPTKDHHVATKQYVDQRLQGLEFQDSVLEFRTTPPFMPDDHARYIIAPSSGQHEWSTYIGAIAEWWDGAWKYTAPRIGCACFVESSGQQYTYNGTSWVLLSNIIRHANLAGLTQDDHTQYLNINGRLGGQTVHGAIQKSHSLHLRHSSDATIFDKTDATTGAVVIQPQGGFFRVGTEQPHREPTDVLFFAPDQVTTLSGTSSVTLKHALPSGTFTWLHGDVGLQLQYQASSAATIPKLWIPNSANPIMATALTIGTVHAMRDGAAQGVDPQAGLVLRSTLFGAMDTLYVDTLDTRTSSNAQNAQPLTINCALELKQHIVWPLDWTTRVINHNWQIEYLNQAKISVAAQRVHFFPPQQDIVSNHNVNFFAPVATSANLLFLQCPNGQPAGLSVSASPDVVDPWLLRDSNRVTGLYGSAFVLGTNANATSMTLVPDKCAFFQALGVDTFEIKGSVALTRDETLQALDATVHLMNATLVTYPQTAVQIGDEVQFNQEWFTVVAINGLVLQLNKLASINPVSVAINVRRAMQRWKQQGAVTTFLNSQRMQLACAQSQTQGLAQDLQGFLSVATADVNQYAVDVRNGTSRVRLCRDVGALIECPGLVGLQIQTANQVALVATTAGYLGLNQSNPQNHIDVVVTELGKGATVGPCSLGMGPGTTSMFLCHKDHFANPALVQNVVGETTINSLQTLRLQQTGDTKVQIDSSGIVLNGNTTIKGHVIIDGTLNYEIQGDVLFRDTLITLGINNTSDLSDSGIINKYVSSSAGGAQEELYAGMIRFATSGRFACIENVRNWSPRSDLISSEFQFAEFQTRALEVRDTTNTIFQRVDFSAGAIQTRLFDQDAQAQPKVLVQHLRSAQQETWRFASQTQPALLLSSENRVGINTSLPSEALDVAGNIRCIGVHLTSDQRLKREIETIPVSRYDSLLQKLRVVSYRFADADLKDRVCGLIAQEVEEWLPFLVKHHMHHLDGQTVHDLRSIDQSQLLILMLLTIQSLQRRVDELESKYDS